MSTESTEEQPAYLAGADGAVALNAAAQAPKEAKILSKPFHLRDLVNEVDRLLAA